MGKLILIVDDSTTVRQQVGIALGQAGFATVEASDGREGLKTICENPAIAMVIFDIKMPHMDGFEMLTEVRKDPRYAKLPMIVLSSEAKAESMKRAKEAGATGWILKPFNVEKLVLLAKSLTGSN